MQMLNLKEFPRQPLAFIIKSAISWIAVRSQISHGAYQLVRRSTAVAILLCISIFHFSY